jgi:branched-chain amino acid transport system permease protein
VLTGAIAGLTAGGIYAVVAVCLTVMARLVRVVNFAQVMVAGVSVYCASALHGHGLPYWLAATVGIAATVVLSCVLGWTMSRWLGDAGIDRRSAVSIAALVALIAASYLAFGSHPRQFVNIVPGTLTKVGGVRLSNAIAVVVVIAVAAAAAGHLVLTRTLLGLRLRALSERPVTAQLLGMRTTPLSVAVWACSGLIAAVVVVVAAPTLVNDQATLAMLVVPGLAAALVGSFGRLDLALAGGLGLGIVQGVLAQVTLLHGYRDIIPFLLILIVLLWSQRREVWDAAR